MSETKAIVDELKETLGDEWVEDDPSILTCYFRDISTIDAPRPQVVVLPSSTEEVQKVILLARRNKYPIVPLSTGFNIAGLTLPRQRGIVMDLKRMNKVLEIDKEAMTVRFQPFVRNAALYAEVNKHFCHEDIRLRIANPITTGSASYFGNIMSGGMSVNAISTGSYHENIAGQVWVLPDSRILRTRSMRDGCTGNVGCVRGPGPDISGMFFNAEGQFGVCTEMVMNLFHDPPLSQMILLRPKNMIKDSFPEIIEFLYMLGRENFISEVYKSSNLTMTALMGPFVEEVARGLPEDVIAVTITGHAQDELKIKEKRVKTIMKRHNIVRMEKGVLDFFFELMNMTEQEFADTLFKRCYRLGGIMRWRGCFYFLGCATTMDRIVDLKKDFDKLIEKTFEPLGPPNTLKSRFNAAKILLSRYIEKLESRLPKQEARKVLLKKLPQLLKDISFFRAFTSARKWERHIYPSHTAIQGPMTLGRGCWLELDMWYDPGDKEERDRIRRFEKECTEMMLSKDLFIPRDFANAFSIQFPRLGVYRDLVRDLKGLMDPERIMNPKVMEV